MTPVLGPRTSDRCLRAPQTHSINRTDRCAPTVLELKLSSGYDEGCVLSKGSGR